MSLMSYGPSLPSPPMRKPEHLDGRLQKIATALEQWTRQRKRNVPPEMWSFPPVVALVTKLDWEVLQLGHAVASHAQAGANSLETESRLVEVETTLSALDRMLSGTAAAGTAYAV